MKNIKKKTVSRRQFIGTTASFASGMAIASPSVFGAPAILRSYQKPDSLINGVQIGAITYSYRSMPDQSAEATLQYVLDSGISAIELMGDPAESFAGKPKSTIDRGANFQRQESTEERNKRIEDLRAQMDDYNKEVAKWRSTVTMDKFTQIRKMYNDAGVQIYAFKPNAFGQNNTDSEIDYGFRAAKALGANHITIEHTSNLEHTLKLGQMAVRHKIYVGYHGHLQQTPTLWDAALDQSEYNMLNLDLGHYVAAGNADPLGIVKAKSDRIVSMHLKDRKNKENGQTNMPWGQGDTPIVQVLQLMRDQKYKFPASAEIEYQIPKNSDAVKEMVMCLEYCRKALEG
ncbi:MAG: sugar phosphate isomerase/epimerase [Bacteroidetes bacterium]|nr:sugar phosphate isomerase/epimerase [Bacteroidota bacterium]MDA1121296.1 sugar phosphate isomerase/epimerase [Bacteroidota bacterium]